MGFYQAQLYTECQHCGYEHAICGLSREGFTGWLCPRCMKGDGLVYLGVCPNLSCRSMTINGECVAEHLGGPGPEVIPLRNKSPQPTAEMLEFMERVKCNGPYPPPVYPNEMKEKDV